MSSCGEDIINPVILLCVIAVHRAVLVLSAPLRSECLFILCLCISFQPHGKQGRVNYFVHFPTFFRSKL